MSINHDSQQQPAFSWENIINGSDPRILFNGCSIDFETGKMSAYYAVRPTKPEFFPSADVVLPSPVVIKSGTQLSDYVMKTLPLLGIICKTKGRNKSDSWGLFIGPQHPNPASWAIDWKHSGFDEAQSIGYYLLKWGYEWKVEKLEKGHIKITWSLANNATLAAAPPMLDKS